MATIRERFEKLAETARTKPSYEFHAEKNDMPDALAYWMAYLWESSYDPDKNRLGTEARKRLDAGERYQDVMDEMCCDWAELRIGESPAEELFLVQVRTQAGVVCGLKTKEEVNDLLGVYDDAYSNDPFRGAPENMRIYRVCDFGRVQQMKAVCDYHSMPDAHRLYESSY